MLVFYLYDLQNDSKSEFFRYVFGSKKNDVGFACVRLNVWNGKELLFRDSVAFAMRFAEIPRQHQLIHKAGDGCDGSANFNKKLPNSNSHQLLFFDYLYNFCLIFTLITCFRLIFFFW